MPAIAVRCSRHEVKFEITNAQHCFFDYCCAPTSESLDPRQELSKCEWLDQIIIATGAQPAYAIIDFAESADDQGRRDNSSCPKTPDDGETIHDGKHSINDNNSVIGRFPHTQAITTMGRQIRFIPARFEEIDNLSGSFGVILNNENAAERPSHIFISDLGVEP